MKAVSSGLMLADRLADKSAASKVDKMVASMVVTTGVQMADPMAYYLVA